MKPQDNPGAAKAATEQMLAQIRNDIIGKVLKNPAINPQDWLWATQYFINLTREFVVGGPHGDLGLTGRKIIV